jgi:hypothetical protein
VSNLVLRLGSRHLQDMLAGTILFGLEMAKQEAQDTRRTGRLPTTHQRETMRRQAWHHR